MEKPIDSRQLNVFVSLASRGSLKAAARDLYVTESAISHSVRNLEESLDVKLFDRRGKRLALTSHGKILLAESTKILGQMRSVRERLLASRPGQQQTLRIACGSSFLRSALPAVIREYQLSHADTVIEVKSAGRQACLDSLERHDVGVGILVNVFEHEKNFRAHPLLRDEIRVVMSKEHPLARRDAIAPVALAKQPIYAGRGDSYTLDLVRNSLAQRGFSLRPVMEMGSQDAVLEMVKLQLGIAFQAEWALERERKNGSLLTKPIQGISIPRTWSFVHLADHELTEPEESLLRLCQRRSALVAPGSLADDADDADRIPA